MGSGGDGVWGPGGGVWGGVVRVQGWGGDWGGVKGVRGVSMANLGRFINLVI